MISGDAESEMLSHCEFYQIVQLMKRSSTLSHKVHVKTVIRDANVWDPAIRDLDQP